MLTGLLIGCAAYVPAPIDPADTQLAFEARTLDRPDLRAYVAPDRREGPSGTAPECWDFEALTRAAYYFSPALDVARAGSATRDAGEQTAAQRPNPTLQLPLGYTLDAAPGASPYTIGLGLDIPIELAGKRGYRIEQARYLSLAERLRVGDVAWQVRSRLRGHLIDLWQVQTRAGRLEQQVAAQQAIARMIDKRVALGAASAPESSQARMALDRYRAELAALAQRGHEARAGAAAVIGVPERELARIGLDLDSLAATDAILPDDDAKAALSRRLDLRAALAEYGASQAVLQLEIANQYPDIHLGPGYSFDAGAHKIVLSLGGIALPLFDHNEGPIGEAVARRAESAARFRALQAKAIGELESAVQQYQAGVAGLRLSADRVSEGKRRLDQMRSSFAAGAADRLEVALAEQESRAIELTRLDAIDRVQRSIGFLEDAIRRPLSARSGAVSSLRCGH